MAIYQEKDKQKWTKDNRSWYYICYYKNLYGENKRKKSKLFKTKKEAAEEERIFLNQVNTSPISNSITFYELIEDYLEYQKEHIKITSYSIILKQIKKLKPLYNIRLKDFNINHFNLWKKEINKENFSTRYKNNMYKLLRAILNYAIKFHDMFFLATIMNKMTNFANPNELKKEMDFYTYEEFIKFIECEDNFKYKVYFELLYFCALRKGEANALTWKDINLDSGTIDINKSLNQKIKGEKYIILPPKTKSSYRILPIPKALLEDLTQLKKEYMNYSNFNEDWFICGGIFPLSDSSIELHNKNNSNKANIKKIRIHDFRHSTTSLLTNNGASINLVSKYLGHSNITTTLNTYSHLFRNQFDEIIDKFNNLEMEGK